MSLARYTRRAYRDSADLRACQALWRAMKRTNPYATYHPGDIEWWVYFNPINDSDFIHLWEDEQGALAGFVVLTLPYGEFEVYVHPQADDTGLMAEMAAWGEAQVLQAVAEQPTLRDRFGEIGAASIPASDHRLRAWLAVQGYTQAPMNLVFGQSLMGEIATPILPAGYHFLEVMRPEWADKRADVHASAFHPSRMTAERYQHFMSAPSYDPTLDIVVVAADGSFAAFAMAWADAELKMGEFEPVGTRTSEQRKGLGRAALLEGLRRLQARGMTHASVCCDAEKDGNVAFYERAGFTQRNRLDCWTKPLSP
jgi:mycothiol synthase